MELLRFIDDKEATNTRKKNKKKNETLRVRTSFSVFLFYQTHRATRIYGYLRAEKIMQIFGRTDHMRDGFRLHHPCFIGGFSYIAWMALRSFY